MHPRNEVNHLPVDGEEEQTNEINEFLQLFQEINQSVTVVKDNFLSINDKICKGEISSAKGISLLEVKNQMLLSYLSNLLFIIMKKCYGKSIAGDPVIAIYLIESVVNTTLSTALDLSDDHLLWEEEVEKEGGNKAARHDDEHLWHTRCFRSKQYRSEETDFDFNRLVELRTVIERIQPIENKLKYQINKLIKIAVTGTSDKNDPKRFRANPDNLVDGIAKHDENSDKDDSSNEDDDEENEEQRQKNDKYGEKSDKTKAGIYVPPKLVPVHYDEDNNKNERMLERARKRALNSSVMEELRDEYLDNPIEVGESLSYKPKRSKFARDKQEYEETYFTRLPASKKEIHKSRHMLSSGNLDGLTNFEDTSVLGAGSSFSLGQKKRKVKQGNGKNKIKKGFKKRRKKFH